MVEILFWTLAVFAVLAGPSLVVLVLDLVRASKKARPLGRERGSGEAPGRPLPRKGGGPGASCIRTSRAPRTA